MRKHLFLSYIRRSNFDLSNRYEIFGIFLAYELFKRITDARNKFYTQFYPTHIFLWPLHESGTPTEEKVVQVGVEPPRQPGTIFCTSPHTVGVHH